MIENRRHLVKSLFLMLFSSWLPKVASAAPKVVGGNADFTRALDDALAGRTEVLSGYYEISNPLRFSLKSGTVKFAPDFQLKFLNDKLSGLVFSSCSDLSLIGGDFSYKNPPARRIGHGGIYEFSRCTKVIVRDGFYYDTPGTGIIFTLCDDCAVIKATVWNSWADGLHFANCNNCIALDYQSTNTGDDGLAFVNYKKHPDAVGGYANNIVINGSYARGIAIIGQSGVTIDKFEIRHTSAEGLKIGSEQYYDTRIPSNVTIKNGIVEEAGTWCVAKATGNGFLVQGATDKIVVENLTVNAPRVHGIVFDRHGGNVKMKDIVVKNTKASGITMMADNIELVNGEFLNIGTTPLYVNKALTANFSKINVNTFGFADKSSWPIFWAVEAKNVLINQMKVESTTLVRIGGKNVISHQITGVQISGVQLSGLLSDGLNSKTTSAVSAITSTAVKFIEQWN
ncbi:right-handed parallel beta-helix repeat-containing protein [Methylobacillus glycogenes]|uniref:right-handed parallel beta-helix repeat-containing protein n=1 Tax=Methylobacillus glycogenes TaxID=406 RepID=UPI000471EF91|nr:right-handed parallel beta-helix repeat-containing protein [Methylobacillus glycogenes]